MERQEECIRTFGHHCRDFYDSGLLLRSSSSSLSSLQEEKKADENIDDKRKSANGKIVLETLDRISGITSMAACLQQQPLQSNLTSLQVSVDNLRHEHALVVERHHDVLLECGLLDADRFCHQDNNEGGSLLQKYVEMRDEMRRRSHKMSMLHRRNNFFQLLSEWDERDENPSDSATPRMAQVVNLQGTLSTIQNFVTKYQSNLGSHPFLAGLYRVVDMQLNPNSGSRKNSRNLSCVVRWKFRGSVLTEACRSCNGEDDKNGGDQLAYAREAVRVIFSFLTWVKDIDLEGGAYIMPICEHDLCSLDDQVDPTLSFEIEKHISNSNLRRILAELPNPKNLDARATGFVEELEPSLGDPNNAKNDAVCPRRNVDGHLDEQWPWFAKWELCTLL